MFAGLYAIAHLELIKKLKPSLNKSVAFCAARLVNVFQRWRNWKIKTQRTEWIYYKQRMLHEELNGEYSMHVLRAALEVLIEAGIVERRNNPSNGQDRTFQYRLDVEKLNVWEKDTAESTTEAAKRELEHCDFAVENHTQDLTTEVNTEILPTQEEEEKEIEKTLEEKPVQCTPALKAKKVISAIKKTTEVDKHSEAAARQVFEKYEERLKRYNIRFKKWDGVAVVDNPQMESAIENCSHLPSEIIEAGLRRFLGYIGNEKNVRDAYALMVFEIRKGEKQ